MREVRKRLTERQSKVKLHTLNYIRCFYLKTREEGEKEKERERKVLARQ